MVIEGVTKSKVPWQEIVSNKVNAVMSHARALLGGEISYSIPYVEIAIHKVKLPDDYDKSTHLRETWFDSNRSICIDENNQLIYGLEARGL